MLVPRIVAALLLAAHAHAQTVSGNLLTNPNFDNGLNTWGFQQGGYGAAGATPATGGFTCRSAGGCFSVNSLIPDGDTTKVRRYAVALSQFLAVPPYAGQADYTLKFYARSSFAGHQTFKFRIEDAKGRTTGDQDCVLPPLEAGDNRPGRWKVCKMTWLKQRQTDFHHIVVSMTGSWDIGERPMFLALDDFSYVQKVRAGTGGDGSTTLTTQTAFQTLTVTLPGGAPVTVTATNVNTLTIPVTEPTTVKAGTLTVPQDATLTVAGVTRVVTETPAAAVTTTITSTTTIAAQAATRTVTTTLAGAPPTCTILQAVFPAACCPTGILPLIRVDIGDIRLDLDLRKKKRQLEQHRRKRAFGAHEKPLERRARSTVVIPATVTTTLTQNGGTVTEAVGATATVTVPVFQTVDGGPLTTVNAPRYIATVGGAEVVTTVTLPPATQTITTVVTVNGGDATATVTATETPAPTCAIETRYEQKTCASGLGGLLGGLLQSLSVTLTRLLSGLRLINNGRPVLVKCGDVYYNFD